MTEKIINFYKIKSKTNYNLEIKNVINNNTWDNYGNRLYNFINNLKKINVYSYLCGGFGTRIREETEFKPKPMINIGTKPISWHIMKSYSHFGFHNFILTLGYKSEIIKNYF